MIRELFIMNKTITVRIICLIMTFFLSGYSSFPHGGLPDSALIKLLWLAPSNVLLQVGLGIIHLCLESTEDPLTWSGYTRFEVTVSIWRYVFLQIKNLYSLHVLMDQ